MQKITLTLKKFDFVVNALLFGSAASGKMHALSDVDIALQVSREPTLFELGLLVSDLEEAIGKDVDIVFLDRILQEDVVLAYEIYLNHKPLFINDKERYERFLELALGFYLDFKPVVEEQRILFLQRLQSADRAKTQTA